MNDADTDLELPGRTVGAAIGDRRDARRFQLLASGDEILVGLGDFDALCLEDILVVEHAHHRHGIGHAVDLAVGAAASAAKRSIRHMLELGNALVERFEVARLDKGLKLAIGLELGNVGTPAAAQRGAQPVLIVGIGRELDVDLDARVLRLEGVEDAAHRGLVLGAPAPQGYGAVGPGREHGQGAGKGGRKTTKQAKGRASMN